MVAPKASLLMNFNLTSNQVVVITLDFDCHCQNLPVTPVRIWDRPFFGVDMRRSCQKAFFLVSRRSGVGAFPRYYSFSGSGDMNRALELERFCLHDDHIDDQTNISTALHASVPATYCPQQAHPCIQQQELAQQRASAADALFDAPSGVSQRPVAHPSCLWKILQ